MCGRFAIDMTAEELAALFEAPDPLPDFPARYNAAPGQWLPVLRYNAETKRRQVDPLRWGLGV